VLLLSFAFFALTTITTPVNVTPSQVVYPLSVLAPRQRLIITGEAPPLCKLALARPLPPGRWELRIEGPRQAGRTVVFSLPVTGGDYTFVVTATSAARYDFVLEGRPGEEYRAALLGPVRRQVFRATLARR
jgi:hypothetical protein